MEELLLQPNNGEREIRCDFVSIESGIKYLLLDDLRGEV